MQRSVYTAAFPLSRPRRLRKSVGLRSLVQDSYIHIDKLIHPLFITAQSLVKKPILSMPGHFQHSLDSLEEEIEELCRLGIKNVILFGIPAQKDALGQSACLEDGIIQQAIPLIKKLAPHLLVITDLCFCEYTDHGHCGFVIKEGEEKFIVDNDKTLELLGQQALSHAKAGADVIAPSGAMDGMVGAIRAILDENGFSELPILSYSVKYASSFYGPFRQAAEGTPSFGDRRTYQMDYANAKEALRECQLDILEGADLLMVKPAHAYLDIIYRIRQIFPELSLGAYHTSGEFAMIKAAAQKGWVNEKAAVLEISTAIFRAGADFLITYFAKPLVLWLGE